MDHTIFLWNSLFVKICESSISKLDGFIHVDLGIDIKCVSIGVNQSLTLIPVLIKDDRLQEFPSIVICGKDRFKAYRKCELFSKFLTFKSDYNIYQVLGAENGKSVFLSYTFKMPEQKWMSDVTLGFYDYLEGQVLTM